MSLFILPLALLSACLPDLSSLITVVDNDTDDTHETGETAETGETGEVVETGDSDSAVVDPLEVDDDGDSYTENAGDCNDADVNVYPGAAEVCNEVDDDCDQSTDEDATDMSTFYRDVDGDGFGVAADTVQACSVPVGYADKGVGDEEDCDDTNATVNPEHIEVCGDFLDNNCDGLTDENKDDDRDGWSTCDGDCDDVNASINPDKPEICDGETDENCDGTVDESTAIGATPWYADADGDSFGSATSCLDACEQPSGYVVDASDCDDTNAAVNTAATEMCDSIDNDCDGNIDESDAADVSTWYADADHDRFGDLATSQVACDMPSGYIADASDCDDTNDAINPDAAEVCDSIDQNCVDGITDEGVDGDGDGESSCAGDCDDADPALNTSASEACDGVDNDCDGTVDNDLPLITVYFDYDLDGHGDPAIVSAACSAPAGYVADNTDCDDERADVNPGASEVCDGATDENCDGSVDESTAADALTWYADVDADGFGQVLVPENACTQPAGYVADFSDCDDTEAAINPIAVETCNSVDDDCDGTVDNGDYDADGYNVCDECDDTDASINPTASESCDGVDQDCDGTIDEGTTCYDDDGDGYAETANDCNDADSAIHPGATDVVDGVDNDCDSYIDEGSVYFDDDSDCYCETAPCTGSIRAACTTVLGDDCDDTASGISPGEAEICDYVDDDCDGDVDEGVLTTYYYDNDSDGYGDDASTVSRCSAPARYVATGGDCIDTDDLTHPGITEDSAYADFACYDHVDNDCDADDAAATGYEWDFGDSDCAATATSGYVADGPNLLSMDTFDGGATIADWSDVPTSSVYNDTLTLGVDCASGPDEVGTECYLYLEQVLTSSDLGSEALCVDAVLTSGLTVGDFYQIAFLARSDESSSIDIYRSWPEEYSVNWSKINLDPPPGDGEYDTLTLTTSWAGSEVTFEATEVDMVFCLGVGEGDISMARPSIRHAL